MKRHRLITRAYLTSAVFAAWLVPAPAAFAVRYAGDDGVVGTTSQRVADTSQGFDWASLAIVVAVVALILVATISVVMAARHRSRLAPSH